MMTPLKLEQCIVNVSGHPIGSAITAACGSSRQAHQLQGQHRLMRQARVIRFLRAASTLVLKTDRERPGHLAGIKMGTKRTDGHPFS